MKKFTAKAIVFVLTTLLVSVPLLGAFVIGQKEAVKREYIFMGIPLDFCSVKAGTATIRKGEIELQFPAQANHVCIIKTTKINK